MNRYLALTLAVWLAIVLLLGAGGAFASQPGMPPYPVALGVAAPLVAFLALLGVSAAFRAFVLAADMPLVTAVQAWRVAGFGFLALAAYRVLPGKARITAAGGDVTQ